MCNGTLALETAVRALELEGEVIVPSFTFIATVHALRWQQITPVFCDVDPRTHNIDVAAIESLITPRTSGIVGVHTWGRPCDIVSLEQIARRHGLGLVFDAAHAFACSHSGRMIGSFGDAEVYSFHATKFVNTFEGGAVVTNNADLAHALRLMRNFGFVDYDRVTRLGINGKMSEVSAAMGLTGLDSLDEFIAVNRRNYEHYRQELDNVPGIKFVTYDEADKHNYQYVVLEVDASGFGVSRDQLMQVLQAENVIARRYFYPGCHQMEPYRPGMAQSALRLPHTEALAQRVMSLPTGTSVGPDAVATICGIIRFVAAHSDEIRSALVSVIKTSDQLKVNSGVCSDKAGTR
jgi:dTDP-4-amino-4,6-dideoxygalactose transaminase